MERPQQNDVSESLWMYHRGRSTNDLVSKSHPHEVRLIQVALNLTVGGGVNSATQSSSSDMNFSVIATLGTVHMLSVLDTHQITRG